MRLVCLAKVDDIDKHDLFCHLKIGMMTFEFQLEQRYQRRQIERTHWMITPCHFTF